jgi:hypothetical protein
MGQRVHILSAGVAMLASLTGMALVVQTAGADVPPAHPITGIFFFVIAFTLLVGLAGLVWDTLGNDPRPLNLLWFAVGGTLGCGAMTFYSVGLFFLIAALDWGVVAFLSSRRQGCPARRGVLLSLIVAGLYVTVMSFMRNVRAV